MLIDNIHILAIAFCIAYIFNLFWSRRRLYFLSWNLPGPIGLPIIGSAITFLVRHEEILSALHKLISKYPPIMKCWIGTQLFVIFRDAKYVEKILTTNKFNTKFDTYKYMGSLLGDGLITGSGPKHRDHRKLIQPLLGLKFTTECFSILEQELKMLITNLDKHVGNGTFNIDHDIHKYITDIIGIVILGKRLHTQEGHNKDFLNALAPTQIYVHSQIVKPWCRLFLFKLTKVGRAAIEGKKIIHAFLNKQIELAINATKTRNFKDFKFGNVNSIIYELASMSQNNLIEQKDLIWEMSTLHAAAADTVSLNISFACLCLGLYPKYQERAAKEISDLFGNTEIKYEDLSKLKYLDMCIKEIFRLFPIGPYILRKCYEDFKIDGQVYPKEVGILIPIFDIHRDPIYWEKPDEFFPDHFLPEAVENRPAYSYIPFSAGMRSCVGRIFATFSMRISLVRILQRYIIEADGKLRDVPIKADISVRPVHGYFVRLKHRHATT